MSEISKKDTILSAMAEVQCIPVAQQEIATQEFLKIPFGQLSAMGAVSSSLVTSMKSVVDGIQNSGTGQALYRMHIPKGLRPGETLQFAKDGGLLGNITGASGRFTQRARFVEVKDSVGAVASINPTVMLMAIAISTVTHKLDQMEETQKDILEFLQLKEKAVLKGNMAVLQEILNEYKYNWDNEKFKINKHIQVQEIKRDAEQSLFFYRDQIEKKVSKNGWIHSDRDVKTKIQKIEMDFRDYELALHIFSFAFFLEVMLLENFDKGYLNEVARRIESYNEQYQQLHKKCCQLLESDSQTSVQAYVLKGVAGINKVLGQAIAKIPKVSDGQIDEKLIENSEKVQDFSKKRTQNVLSLIARDHCASIKYFVGAIYAVSQIFNEPVELFFDKDNVFYSLTEQK